MKRVRSFLQLSWRDKTILTIAFTLLGLVRLGLWLVPFQRLRLLLAKISNISFQNHEFKQVSIGKIIWAVETSSRYMPGVKCLARALTTQVLMSQHGHFCELKIGVAKGEQGQLEAHAWIESQGKIIIGYLADISRFMPLQPTGGGGF